MIRLYLGLLCVINTFNAFKTENIVTQLNAINYDNLIQKIDFHQFEREYRFESNARQNNATVGYDDAKCVQQFSTLQTSLNESEMWAIEVMDASGKTQSGILSGNIYSLGDFDQCLAVKHEITSNEKFDGQYCRMEVLVNISAIFTRNIQWQTFEIDINSIETEHFTTVTQRRLPRPTQSNIWTYGICGPATCSPEMLTEIITEALVQSNISYVSDVTIAPISCQKQVKNKFEPEDIFAISFFVLIALLMLASTAYDIIKTRSKKPQNDVLIAFSVLTNASKILAQSKSSNEITCLHGLRSLSMMWVLTSHVYELEWYMPMTNANYLLEWITKYYSMVILSTNKAVDTFLFMSALLLTWLLLKQLRNNNGKFNYARICLHRYLRVTPSLAVCLLFVITIYKFVGNSPYWPDFVAARNRSCRNNWWSLLLYIQNYYNPRQICMGHTWYLSPDMQLYILSPPFIYLLFRYKNKIIPLLVAFCVACSGVVIYFFIKYDFDDKLIRTPEGDESNTLRRLFTYHPTHARASSWIVGVIFGYILFCFDGKKVHMKKITLYIGWTNSILFLLGSIFGNYPLQQLDGTSSSVAKGLYHALPRVAWPAALSFIIFACHFGYGGIIDWFLSLPQWQPISRLTYSMYLTHELLLNAFIRLYKTSRYFNDIRSLHSIIGHLGLTLMVSFVFSLAFEYPIVVLEKLAFKRKSKATEIRKESSTVTEIPSQAEK